MGGNPLTQQVARGALRKLEAEDITSKGSPHPRFAIYYDGKIVATTGLRHSPKKDMLVPHIKNDLRVNAKFILDLHACPKSRLDWLAELGLVQDDNELP